MENLEQLTQQAIEAIEQVESGAALDQIRVDYLGKKGLLTQLLKGLGALDAAEIGRASCRERV